MYMTDAFISLRARRCSKVPPLPGRTDIYGAVIQSQITQRYALVQGKQTGKWSFPKGHVNRFETPLECVTREVREETGIDNLPQPLQGISLEIGYYYAFSVINEVSLIPSDMNEIQETGWFTIDEMQQLTVNIDVSTFLKRAYRYTQRK
jgi:8-oxo-dGTP pyrophosphatase MutT (NUDIX family)